VRLALNAARATHSIKRAAVRGRTQQRGHRAELRRGVDRVHRRAMAMLRRILELVGTARAASAHRRDELLHLFPLKLRRVRGVLCLIERCAHRGARRARVAALDPPPLNKGREEVTELRSGRRDPAVWQRTGGWEGGSEREHARCERARAEHAAAAARTQQQARAPTPAACCAETRDRCVCAPGAARRRPFPARTQRRGARCRRAARAPQRPLRALSAARRAIGPWP